MTPRILTACAIAALTVGTEARAQQLPAWTPQSICAEDATPEHCGFLEGQARTQISQQWQFIPTLVRERCIADSGEQETQSWRLFGECLATAARPPQGQDNGEFVQAQSLSKASEENLAEIAAIRAELDAARARVEELDAAQAASVESAAGSAAQLTALEAELEQAEAGRTESEARVAELQQQLTAATAAAAAAAAAQLAASSEAEAGMADMRSSLDEATTRAEGAEQRISTLEQELATAIADAEAARGEAGEAEEAENARIAELEEALAKADADAKLANVRIEGLQERLVEMSDAAAAEPEQNPEQLVALEASLASAEAENQRSATQVQALRARIVELMDALMTDEPAEQDAPDANRIAELEASLAEAEARVEELNAAESAAPADDERIAELEASLASAQTEMKRSNARIEGLQARLVEAMDAASVEAPAASDASDAQVAELEGTLAAAQGEIDRLTGRIEGLQGRLISTRNSVAQSRAAFGDATATIAEKEEQIAALEADLGKAQSDMRSREVRIEGLQQRLMEAVDAQEAETAGGEETAALEGRLKVAESRIRNLTSRLRNARDAGKAAQSEKSRAEGNLAMARERITALQDAMIEQREAAQAQEATGNEARNEAIASSQRLQTLLDNQRERSARVAGTVSEQRDRIAALESELRDARREAQNAVVQTALVQPAVVQPAEALASCAQQMNEIMSADGIQFAINTAEIRADAIGVIDELIAVARTCEDARITVRGHTDAIGERSYNIYLSQLRADAVVDYMERNGIAPDRVDGVGIGPDEPVSDNRTRAGRAANRRIEIVVE